MLRKLSLVALLGLAAAREAAAQERVDLLLRNAKVFTADPLMSIQHAVAIRDGRIIAVGGNEIAARYRADSVLDLGGRLVTPGLIDTHIHMRGEGKRYVELADFKTIGEIQDALRAKAKELGPGEWITGYGWAEGLVREKRSPLRADLDAATPNNPVVLSRAGGHSVTTNSAALKLAGITKATPEPEGGVIERDANGEPNGIIRERSDLVTRLVPRPSADEVRPSFVANLKRLLSLGITSIIDAGVVPRAYAEWEAVYRENPGQLPRATLQFYPGLEKGGATADQALKALKDFGRKTGDGNEWIRVGAVKLWLDGGFAGPAAWTLKPYRNQPKYFGIQNIEEADLYRVAKAAHDAGWQLGWHTIGDAAIELGVKVLRRIQAENPRDNARHYLTHFTVMPEDSVMRAMAEANILIAQQPNFTWAPTLESRYVDNLEGERLNHNNSVRTPMNHGIFMAFGSDNHPIGPMPGLYGSTTRKGISGRVYSDAERISMAEALIAYTRNGAYFTFEEKIKGTIEPGKLADLVVFDKDLLEIEPAEILDTKVDLTILGGRIVYRRAGAQNATH